MSTKISKSDVVLSRAEEDAQRAAQAAKPRPKSQHFEVGTFVNVRQERAEVVARPGNGWMLVRYEDQTTEILRPYALSWEC